MPFFKRTTAALSDAPATARICPFCRARIDLLDCDIVATLSKHGASPGARSAFDDLDEPGAGMGPAGGLDNLGAAGELPALTGPEAGVGGRGADVLLPAPRKALPDVSKQGVFAQLAAAAAPQVQLQSRPSSLTPPAAREGAARTAGSPFRLSSTPSRAPGCCR